MPHPRHPATLPTPAQLAVVQTHTFDSYVLRGRTEREYPVEAGYQIIDGKAVLTRWCIIGDTYPLTSGELERLDEEAEDYAAEVMDECALELAAGRVELGRAA